MSYIIAAVLMVFGIPSTENRPKHCVEYHFALDRLGFSSDDKRMAHRVMFRESRCNPLVTNRTDPHGGSLGLFQINRFWCLPNRYSPNGWLQSQGIIEACEDLYNPMVNIRAMKAIWDYSNQANGNGWQPWGM